MTGPPAPSVLELVQRIVATYLEHRVPSRAVRSVTMNEDLVLLHLSSAPSTNAELCRKIGITSASMSHLVAALERRGLLRRLPDLDDRRKVLVYASKSAISELHDEELERELDELLQHLEPGERQAVVEVLVRTANVLADS